MLIACLICKTGAFGSEQWSTLRGDVARSGFSSVNLSASYGLLWVRHFFDQRIATAVEPIVAYGFVFIATHNGRLYALKEETGQPVWSFSIKGAFLHSPSVSGGTVIIGGTDGFLYGLDALSGRLKWFRGPFSGGFAASPCIAAGKVFIGTRSRLFLCGAVGTGKILWTFRTDGPVYQTASFHKSRVYVTDESLRVYCWDADSGRLLWTSRRLNGQSARDYYPVIVSKGPKTYVIVRTNPADLMSRRISEDRSFLCQRVGVDDSDWRNLEAWIRTDQAIGSPELWEREQRAIIDYLKRKPDAQTFFVWDGETGEEGPIAPVLWTGGCQGVGPPPVALQDRQVATFYRTAYGNWNLGVAPLIGVGILDIASARITPLHHRHGRQPPWNTFWGTADEAQNLQQIGRDLLFIHQGTLSAFNTDSASLRTLWGKRDTWGGFPNLPWAQNEWHGPARGGVAVSNRRIFWITGSRILALAPSGSAKAVDIGLSPSDFKTATTPASYLPKKGDLQRSLESHVQELIGSDWAPLIIQPGLAGTWILYDNSGDIIETLAWAYPHLSPSLKKDVLTYVRHLIDRHPPLTDRCRLAPINGKRRESFRFRPDFLALDGHERPHPFGNLFALSLFSQRSGDGALVQRMEPFILPSWNDFVRKVALPSDSHRFFVNRYLSSLLSLQGEKGLTAEERQKSLSQWSDALVGLWKRAQEESRLRIFSGIREWDDRIAKGEPFLLAVRPHRARLLLFDDLTPQVASLLLKRCPESVRRVWKVFSSLCPTWHIVGGERQIHYGENFVDPPDFAESAFRALAFLTGSSAEELIARLDVPYCPADLSYIVKVSLVLDKLSRSGKTSLAK